MLSSAWDRGIPGAWVPVNGVSSFQLISWPRGLFKVDRTVGEDTTSILERLGGNEVVGRWVETFYDLIEQHPLLAPMFKNVQSAREKQYAYFIEAFGGPLIYTEAHGRPFLRFKHRHFKIGQAERDAWMELVMIALKSQLEDEAMIGEMETWLGEMADKMINHHPEKQDAYYFQG